jgi:hypothetical protein
VLSKPRLNRGLTLFFKFVQNLIGDALNHRQLLEIEAEFADAVKRRGCCAPSA